MDYERIQKPQGGGGFSPGKLRSMLLGVEKKRKQEEELDSNFTPRSRDSDMDESGGSSSDHCKYVDVVSVLPEYSTSTDQTCNIEADCGDRLAKANAVMTSRNRILEDPSLDYDSMIMSPSMFEFQKAERAPPRVPVGPFSKPAPSKWDDAQKWIASPTSNRPKTGQSQGQGGHAVPRKVGGLGSRQASMKVVVEVPDQKEIGLDEPDTKQIDANQTKMESGGQKFVNWDDDPYAIADAYAVSLSQHNSSIAAQTAATFVPPPSTARSVSMRDMGTEMTPIASQEPSRTGTPVGATTPMRSPNSSRPSTPTRAAPSIFTDPCNDNLNLNKNELSEKELQMKTRREIMVLGTQLGKMNIAAWASKEEEDKDASTSLKTKNAEQQAKSVVEARAAAWEEAEKAKYMARFRRDEMKIQAWENHQKAKTEAKMRKIEVEVERIRSKSHDKLMNKLAAARHKAEEKRAAAEADKNNQAAKPILTTSSASKVFIFTHFHFPLLFPLNTFSHSSIILIMAKGASQSQSSTSTSSRPGGGGIAAPRGSAAATAGMRRRRLTSGNSTASVGGGSSGGSNMLRFYTDDAPGLKISPTVVLVMSLCFIGFVTALHVFGKLYRYKAGAGV